jgi:putative addiction module CopG family antidote
MEVELSDRARKVIEQRVADGDFANAAEAIEEAVRLLEEQHAAEVARLRTLVQEGIRSSEEGTPIEVTPAFYEAIRERIRARAVTLDKGRK